MNIIKELTNGEYWFYKLEQGGAGIVKAYNFTEAEQKVKNAYLKHSSPEFCEEIEVYKIEKCCCYFEDVPDVIEIYEY